MPQHLRVRVEAATLSACSSYTPAISLPFCTRNWSTLRSKAFYDSLLPNCCSNNCNRMMMMVMATNSSVALSANAQLFKYINSFVLQSKPMRQELLPSLLRDSLTGLLHITQLVRVQPGLEPQQFGYRSCGFELPVYLSNGLKQRFPNFLSSWCLSHFSKFFLQHPIGQKKYLQLTNKCSQHLEKLMHMRRKKNSYIYFILK